MDQTWKAAHMAHETNKYNIQVLGLSETRWNGPDKLGLLQENTYYNQDMKMKTMRTYTEWQ